MSNEKQRNRMRRLRILQQLEAIAPNSLSEDTLLSVVAQDPDLEPTSNKIKRSLSYLRDLDLIELQSKVQPWSARIKAKGLDYLEGDGTDIQGIAHPEEFLSGQHGE